MIKTYHATDTKYKRHCVDCGKLLVEYEAVHSCHRNERGGAVEREKHFVLLEGRRCKGCHDSIVRHIEKYYEKENTAWHQEL